MTLLIDASEIRGSGLLLLNFREKRRTVSRESKLINQVGRANSLVHSDTSLFHHHQH